MNIFKTIAATAYDKVFYKRAKDHTLGKVIGYYAKLSLLLGLVALLFAVVTISPRVAKGVREAGDDVLSTYPTELVVKITKGEVSTNAPAEPIIIATPKLFINEAYKAPTEKFPANFVTIDTRATSTISFEEFKDMDTAVFVGRTYIISLDDGGAIAYRDLSKAPDITINRALIEKIIGFASVFWIILPIIFFVGVFIGSFLTLIYLILLALTTLLVSHNYRQKVLLC